MKNNKRYSILPRAAAYVAALVILVLACVACSNTAPSSLFSYADKNAGYSLVLTESDSERSVSLDVTRRDGITEAKIVSPEPLNNVKILHDGSVTRVTSGELDIPLSEDAAKGVSVLFNALSFSDSSKASTDALTESGETSVKFSVEDAEIDLILNGAGLPANLDVMLNGVLRHCEIKDFKIIE